MKIKLVQILIAACILLLIGVGVLYQLLFYASNVKFEEGKSIYVYENDDFSSLDSNYQIFSSPKLFNTYVSVLDKKGKIKKGHYIIKPSMSNRDIFNKLVSGNQDPIRFTFNRVNSLPHFAKLVGENFAVDSTTFIDRVLSSEMKTHFKYNEYTVMSFLIPNTYEFYWTTSPRGIMLKLNRYLKQFWNTERRAKARHQNLSKLEVSTLASIIINETQMKDELPIVAGLYLNRLRTGHKLQADPTVKFALQLQNKHSIIKRILTKDLQIDSPFNTYKHRGLPPAPISSTPLYALDAVLNAPRVNYVYMCADPNRPGYHQFTNSYRQHLANAKIYRKWLNEKNIYR